MSLLFEYGQWTRISNKTELKSFLRHIWGQRLDESALPKNEVIDNHYQPFLTFDGDLVRANNYIGFIQNGNELIEIYPKVFRENGTVDKALMLRHIFYWFGYCRKWKFPFTQSSLEPSHIERFPELIINLIASQFLAAVSERPLMQYQAQEETLESPRGNINFSRYIHQSASKGNLHKLECDYEPFLFNNKVNRVIKYCTRLLLPQTQLVENQRLLQEILFVLDEADDLPFSAQEIETIFLNSFYDEYKLILSICKNIVAQKMYSHNEFELPHWCLLFPMEYVFEDFIAGFIQTHFANNWIVEYQKSDQYLVSEPEVFQMQHDIFLTHRESGRQIIIDTKYKLRQFQEGDLRGGVIQGDMYQVLSYAVRRGCREVWLVYPNATEFDRSANHFEFRSGFFVDTIIVKIIDLPFWSLANFEKIETNLKSEIELILYG